MTPPDVPAPARAVAGKARELAARVRPGSLEGRRSLPVRRPADDLRRLWDQEATRASVLDGLPAGDATLEVGEPDRDFGTTVTLSLKLQAPLPGIGTQTLAGTAVRRFKALAETGEVPTTAHNPSARPDAGEAAA